MTQNNQTWTGYFSKILIRSDLICVSLLYEYELSIFILNLTVILLLPYWNLPAVTHTDSHHTCVLLTSKLVSYWPPYLCLTDHHSCVLVTSILESYWPSSYLCLTDHHHICVLLIIILLVSYWPPYLYLTDHHLTCVLLPIILLVSYWPSSSLCLTDYHLTCVLLTIILLVSYWPSSCVLLPLSGHIELDSSSDLTNTLEFTVKVLCNKCISTNSHYKSIHHHLSYNNNDYIFTALDLAVIWWHPLAATTFVLGVHSILLVIH